MLKQRSCPGVFYAVLMLQQKNSIILVAQMELIINAVFVFQRFFC